MKPTRIIEMGVGEGESHGQWWTEYVNIPWKTPEEDISEVAITTYQREHLGDEKIIGLLEVYWVPELDDELNYRFYLVLRDIYASELAMLAQDVPDFVMIERGDFVREYRDSASESDDNSVDAMFDYEFGLAGTGKAWISRADLVEVR